MIKTIIIRALLLPLAILLYCASVLGHAATDSVTSTNAQETGELKIATVTPIAHGLSTGLLRHTGIQTDFLPPQRLPINRIESWLRKNRSRKFDRYDALVSISDAVPALNFSSTLRQSNIRLVTIDIAYARLPEGERVVINNPSEYFWLNTNNLLLMLGVLKRDLGLMWPEHRERINHNYQNMSAELRKVNLKIENLLFDNDIAVLVFDKAVLEPLAGSLSMDVTSRQDAQAVGLPALFVGSRRPRQRPGSNSAPQTPSQAPSQSPVPRWVIDDLSRFDDQTVVARLQANLQSLREVLK